MGNKTIYIKDDGLWERAKRAAGKEGLSAVISQALRTFVEKAATEKAGYTLHRIPVRAFTEEAVNPSHMRPVVVEQVSFDGRFLAETDSDFADVQVHGLAGTNPTTGRMPTAKVAVYETKAKKLVITRTDIAWDTVIDYAVVESLNDLGKHVMLAQVPCDQRVDFLNAVSAKLGGDWSIWID